MAAWAYSQNKLIRSAFLFYENPPEQERLFPYGTPGLGNVLRFKEFRSIAKAKPNPYQILSGGLLFNNRHCYIGVGVSYETKLGLKEIELYHRAECLTHVGDSQAVRSLTQCGEPMRFAMAAPIDLRNDFDSVSLRRLAKRTRDATQSRRLLALAEVYDGGSRTDASRIGGVGLQIIRDWVLRFNARGPDGLVDGKSPGAPSKLNADHRRALAEVVEAGPVPAVDGVVRWRRKDLARWLLETFAISLDETTVGRELKALGFAKISARPRHYAQNELAVEALKKGSVYELYVFMVCSFWIQGDSECRWTMNNFSAGLPG